MNLEFVHLEADFCHCIGCLLLIRHIANTICLIVDGTYNFHKRKLGFTEPYVTQCVGEIPCKVTHSEGFSEIKWSYLMLRRVLRALR